MKIISHPYTRILLLAVGIIYTLIEAQRTGDFYIFLKAAEALRSGADIYSITYVDGFHFFNSPLFATLLVPFTFFPPYFPKLIWLWANLFFIYRIFCLIPCYLDMNVLSEKQRTLFWLIGALFCARFIFFNLHIIQLTIFLLYGLLQGIKWVQEKKYVCGSLILALVINIKILPLVILPWLVYRSELKAFSYTVVFSLLFLFLPGLFIGWEYCLSLNKSWWNLINPSNSRHLIDIEEPGFHGLTSFLPTLLIEKARNNNDLTFKRNIADLSENSVVVIINATRAALVIFSFYFLRSFPFRKAPSALHQWWELSYLFLLIPLIFPHQQYYAFFFLAPAFFYLIYFTILYRPSKKMLNTGLALIFLLTSFLGGFIGFLREWTNHYKLITYGSLITLLLLALSRPSFLATFLKKKN